MSNQFVNAFLYVLLGDVKPQLVWNEQSIRQCIADVTIVEMRESGMSFPIIAEKMGSDAASVYGVYKRAKRAKT